MKFFVKYYTPILVVIFFCVTIPSTTLAQSGGGGVIPYNTGGGGSSNTLVNPLLNVGSLCDLLQKFLEALLMIGVPIAVLFLVYAGFLFVKARGNPKELIRAHTNFKFVILGIMLFLGAWMLGQIMASTINKLGAGTGAPGVGSCR